MQQPCPDDSVSIPPTACDHAEERAREECPTPLSSVQVLDAFQNESTPWQLEREFYTLNGCSWGEGAPIYFLNGISGTRGLYALLAWLLREEFRCVFLDYPDQAQPAPLSAESLSDDLMAVADLHGDEHFGLHATSFGCLVALAALLRHPHRIERAVLQGGFAHRQLTLLERTLAGACRHLGGHLHNLPMRRQIQQQNHRPWFPPFDFVRWKLFTEDTGTNRIAAVAQRAQLIQQTDFRSRLREITTPVLLIHSEGEGSLLEQCHEELRKGLPNAESVRLENTGHVPYWTHPHRQRKVIVPFLLVHNERAAAIEDGGIIAAGTC